MSYKAHILIVDDVSDNIQIAMNILKENSYSFSFASDGQEALDIMERESEQIDLILLDIMMPVIDGYEVCRVIKENPISRLIPIIFLTAKTDIDSISKGFELGAVDYIMKPFHANELLARVHTHIELYQSKKLLQMNNLALEAKVKYGHERLYTELENNQKDMIFMLTELMEFTSDETGKHIKRVAEISSMLARLHPSLSEEDADILYHASPLHDIGKMTIPHDILHKPGRLTEEEFDVMKNHAVNAYELLRHSKRKLIQGAAVIAHEHHEKWNGQGYPRQLKGNEIHIYGRIVALADVFDALTHKRCYKEAWNFDEAVGYIQEHRGTQFDPELIDIFIQNVEEFRKIILSE